MDHARWNVRRSRLDSAQQVGLQITSGHLLDAGIGMRGVPPAKHQIVLQGAVASRLMRGFTDEPQQKLGAAIARHGESYRVTCSLLGQPPASCGVSQVTAFPQFLGRRFGTFMSRCGALATPSAPQRKARRMQPAAVVQFAGRHEKWARHGRLLIRMPQFYSEPGSIASDVQNSGCSWRISK